ncbi:MAG: hypothetical protein R3Y26_08375 [Rikenellaceae bacterium]
MANKVYLKQNDVVVAPVTTTNAVYDSGKDQSLEATLEALPDVVQNVGDSTSDVMSQKAVTDNFLLKGDIDLEELLAYGIQFDTTVSAPECTRIGNVSLHKTLPIQSAMKGCLLNDNGDVVEYLPSGSWEDSVRDGSVGQVMVEIPDHYRKFVTDGTLRKVMVSLYPLAEYTLVPKMYVSAYEATMNRTTSTLASVVNLTADYRGGNNNADYDETYRTFLGRPAVAMSLTNFRTNARNRKTDSVEWNCMTYEAHKAIFWLFTVEYATLDSQAAVNAELTAEGYKQGGLGDGPTTVTSDDWNNLNSYSPFIPCGHTDSLGNGTGQVLYEVYDETNEVTISTYANRYRGIENLFGHLFKWVDGIFVDIRTDSYEGDYSGQSRVFVAKGTSYFASPTTLADSYDGYEYRGDEYRVNSVFVKELIFGEHGDLMHLECGNGGSSSTYYCDYHYTDVSSSSIRAVQFGGRANLDSYSGLAFTNTFRICTFTTFYIGSRLCFHPNGGAF